MTDNCSPDDGAPLAIDNPCAFLGQLRGALYTLMMGEAQAEIRMGDRTLRFHPANVAALKAEVQRLETMCVNGQVSTRGRAVQVQYRPRAGLNRFIGNRY